MPVIQHLLHSLGEGKIFAKLDMAQAYQQLPVDRAMVETQTIVTHRGAFNVTHLQFGISVAPGIFQSVMERLLHKIPGVVPYFDDVLVTAGDREQLLQRLRRVFQTFHTAGLKLRLDKCQIEVPEVEFLGYKVDGQGIHPTKDKIQAIQSAPAPRNRTELQSFLGLINFYHNFLKGKATIADSLHRLLAKNSPWVWGEAENRTRHAGPSARRGKDAASPALLNLASAAGLSPLMPGVAVDGGEPFSCAWSPFGKGPGTDLGQLQDFSSGQVFLSPTAVRSEERGTCSLRPK